MFKYYFPSVKHIERFNLFFLHILHDRARVTRKELKSKNDLKIIEEYLVPPNTSLYS